MYGNWLMLFFSNLCIIILCDDIIYLYVIGGIHHVIDSRFYHFSLLIHDFMIHFLLRIR